jgi:hypothetical protein
MIKIGKTVASPFAASQDTEEENEEMEYEGDEISLDSEDTEESSEKSDNGHDERIFRVNKDILCATSMFFQEKTNSVYADLSNRIIELPEKSPEDFDLYLKWLRTQNVAVKKDIFDADEDNGALEKTCLITLARCYVLGARVRDATYQNLTLKKFIDCIVEEDSCPCNEAIRVVYAGTSASSPARNLFVDIWLWRAHGKWDLNDTVGEAGVEFANDVIKTLVTHRELPDGVVPWVEIPEKYELEEVDGVVYEEGEGE